MNTTSLFVDMSCAQRMKAGEDICGDTFKFSRIPGEDRIVAVLSDGLGSGIKANILATMTAAMAMKFTTSNKDILESAEIIMGALPICRTRKISYATFTVIDTAMHGPTRVVEMGNPPFQLFRNGKNVTLKSKQVESPGWRDRMLDVYEFDIEPEDRFVFFSDGITQAGMGTRKHRLGWRSSGCRDFIEEQLEKNSEISSHELANTILKQALSKEPGRVAHDDMTCSTVYFRHPKKLLLVSGPPFDKDHDIECAEMLKYYDGCKVICGGTTAEIVARELGKDLRMDLRSLRSDLPPTSQMDGIDLITEGIFTLTRTAKYLEKGTGRGKTDPAGMLVDTLLCNDIIEIIVGTRINEAHQDPNLPVDIEIRRNIIRRIAATLRDKYLKEVKIQYI